MAGDQRPVQIDANNTPFLTSGAKVADGYGTMLVTAVGTSTALGEMMSSTTRGKTETRRRSRSAYRTSSPSSAGLGRR